MANTGELFVILLNNFMGMNKHFIFGIYLNILIVLDSFSCSGRTCVDNFDLEVTFQFPQPVGFLVDCW